MREMRFVRIHKTLQDFGREICEDSCEQEDFEDS